MRTEQLYYFLETARCGSFSKAAENLYIKQPSLRESINSLENEIGAKLFHTSNKGVSLTNYGAKCVPIFQKIVSLYEEVKIHTPIYNDDEMLTVGVDLYMHNYLKKITENRFSDFNKYVLFQDALTCLENLLNDKLDLAVLLLPRNVRRETMDNSIYKRIQNTLISNHLTDVPFHMVTVKNHPLWHLKNFTLSDFQNYQILVPDFLQFSILKHSASQNLLLDLHIADPKTQVSKIFLTNAISLNDLLITPVIDYTRYPNIINIDISDLLPFGLYAFYSKNSAHIEQIENYLSALNIVNS